MAVLLVSFMEPTIGDSEGQWCGQRCDGTIEGQYWDHGELIIMYSWGNDKTVLGQSCVHCVG